MVSKQIRNLHLHGAFVNNLPSHDGQFHPWDERPQDLSQFPQETRIDRVRYQDGDDRAFLLLLKVLGKPLTLLEMAKQFRRFVAALDSSQNRANMRLRYASI